MKKSLLAIVLIVLIAVPSSFAQFRVDLGANVPLAFGFTNSQNIEFAGAEVTEFLLKHFFPIPEASAYYFFNAGNFRFGLGGRAFTLILQSVIWPNAVVEFEISKFVLEAQFGGGLFMFFGILNTAKTSGVFFPDISAWFKLGETFRLGAGVLSVLGPDLNLDGLPLVFYIGGKATIGF